MADDPTWDLVLKRNSIERLKKEKAPLQIIDYLPELIDRGYEEIAEEDIVRFQWYGLYHDKPKIGFFMLRVKIPSGILSPAALRAISDLCVRYGRGNADFSVPRGTGYAELSTRQNLQLHWIELRHLPDILQTLDGVGLNMRGGCGDTVRNITGCPVAGLDCDELFDTRPLIEEAAQFFYGNPAYSDLPRKHKITIAACAHQCNAPEINCISLIGAERAGQQGFAVRIGGGLSTVPRLARDLGVFVAYDEAIPVLRAIIDVWQETLKYRLSRVKARLKFMVDDIGPEEYRRRVEDKLGRRLPDFTAPAPVSESDHIGIYPQKGDGLFYIGFPVFLGVIKGDQMLRLADLAAEIGGDIRLTRQQNFILTGVPEGRVDEVVARVAEIGFPLDVNRLRASSIACTGQPLCNYAVASTKTRLEEIVGHLERTLGREVEGLRLNVDGCPHACGHHWIGDIGLQGTTSKERGAEGEKQEAYEMYLRGGLGADAAIGRPIVRRVPADQAHLYVERLARAYLAERQDGGGFKAFADRHTDEELISIATARPLADVIAENERRPVHRERRHE
ncbi:MAG: nitrite/sulfite reductase [Anaerolineae bacterium]